MFLRVPKNPANFVREELQLQQGAIDFEQISENKPVIGWDGFGRVGISHCDSPDITVVVSGRITNVPAPFANDSVESATNTLAELYSKHGEDVFKMIDGTFICAIFDWSRSSVIFARDKIGIARAYMADVSDAFVFSDSLAELLRADNTKHELDLDSIFAFITIGWVPTPHSMFRGIAKIQPGTFFRCMGDNCYEVEYYDIPHSSKFASLTTEEIQTKVAEKLDQAVARGLAANNNCGSFLSGGVDSSSVVACMARQNGGEFPTYFGGFSPYLNKYLPNPEEPEMSKMVATKYNTKHNSIWLDSDVTKQVPEIVRALEEPVSDGGCIVIAEVIKAAAHDNLDCLMTGIGGDFLFTGERRHMVLKLLDYIRPVPDFVWSAVMKLLGLPIFSWHTRLSQIHFDLTKLLALRQHDIETMYASFFLQAEPEAIKTLMQPEIAKSLTRSPRQEMDDFFVRASNMDPQSRFLYLDLKMQTPDHCVREAETLGRYFGVPTYHPFLDAEMVDFAMSLPSSVKTSGLELKVPLKKAMEDRVPKTVLYRKKGGLGSPIRWWVTQSDGYVANTLSRKNIERRGLFSADAIEEFRRSTENGQKDYTRLLWSLFTLELWMQEFVDGYER